MHMNNTRYPDMLCDHLDEMTEDAACRLSSVSLSYLKEAHIGATLTVCRGKMNEHGLIEMRTVNESGEICLEATVGIEKI